MHDDYYLQRRVTLGTETRKVNRHGLHVDSEDQSLVSNPYSVLVVDDIGYQPDDRTQDKILPIKALGYPIQDHE